MSGEGRTDGWHSYNLGQKNYLDYFESVNTYLKGILYKSGGYNYDVESYGILNGISYDNSVSITKEISNDQLNQLIDFFNHNNYYSLLNHNCSSIESNIWNKLFDYDLNPMIIIPLILGTNIIIICPDLPMQLKQEIKKHDYTIFDPSDLIRSFIEER